MKLLLLVVMSLVLATVSTTAAEIVLSIRDTPQGAVDARLFGQFLERPSWDKETGPEGFVQADGTLPPEIMAQLAAMRIPVVRFPGGTDIDFIDWTDLIDVPGRAQRPPTIGHRGIAVTNRYGWHEYASTADQLGWETIAVVNLLDGLAKRKPLAEAAAHAAGLVAYLNLPLGSTLPTGLRDWPALRAANGRPAPARAHYIQLGNEWWVGGFRNTAEAALGTKDPSALAAWYIEVLHAYITAIHAVDPTVELIIDAEMGGGIEALVLADPLLRRAVRHVAIHIYAGGSLKTVTRDGQHIPVTDVDPVALWRSMVAIPGEMDDAGQSRGLGAARTALATVLGYQVALTEWNWNFWEAKQVPVTAAGSWRHAGGVAVACLLNGFLRQSEVFSMGTQSLLLGHGWDIAALRRLKDGTMVRLPQGQVTTFYAAHHGPNRLDSTLAGAALTTPTLGVGWNGLPRPAAVVDALATGGKGLRIAHLVNRDVVTQTVVVRAAGSTAILHLLRPVGGLDAVAGVWYVPESQPVAMIDGTCRIELPAAGIAALEITGP